MKKTRDEIVVDILGRFEEGTEIINTNPGSIVRTFSEVMAEEMGQFYSEMNLVSTMAFVSTAKGNFLDLLGAILNCTRLQGEIDENFRLRITEQVYVIAGGNETAIRLKLLELESVKDVVLVPFTRGSGSFTAYIITDEMETSEATIQAASLIVEKAKSYGVYATVKRPVLIYVNLGVRLLFEEGATLAQRSSITENVRTALKSYADNIEIGGKFITIEALRVMKNASEAIVDINIEEMYVNNARQFVRNVHASKGERIFLEHVGIM